MENEIVIMNKFDTIENHLTDLLDFARTILNLNNE